MRFQLVVFLFSCTFPPLFASELPLATIVVRGSATVAQTDDNFVCATLDWWPPEKCNYDQCPWGTSSVLNLDLKQARLAKAIQAFGSLRIRVGGSLQDQVDYGLPDSGHPCPPFSKMATGLFGFSKGCLSMTRWDELNLLFKKTGAVVTFGLNALRGRTNKGRGTWEGPWNSTNARDFIRYTVARGYPVDSWEFGNELSGKGIGASVGAQQYGKDVISLKAILDELYTNSSSKKPLLLAPGGFYDRRWYSQLLEASGPGIVDGLTHHIYNLGGGDDPRIESKILDPQYLGGFADTFRGLQNTLRSHGPWSSAWVGEAGGVFNSGSRRVSNTFMNSFWYLDQLGMASKYNTKAYCRQTLVGGNYGLLDTKTLVPNPDYYSAILWHRLMGKGVLSVETSGSPYLRAYAHCRKHNAGVTLLMINLSKAARFHAAVKNDDIGVALKKTTSWAGRTKKLTGSARREEYHLVGKDGDDLSRAVMLNGIPLQLTRSGDIPALDPVLVSADSPVSVAPLSIAFVVLPGFRARACQ